MSWIGIDRGDESHEHLEHDLLEVLAGWADGPRLEFLGTHMVRDGSPHWAGSVALGGATLPAGADVARRLVDGLGAQDCAGRHPGVFADPHGRGDSGTGTSQVSAAVLGEPGEDAVLLGADSCRLGAYGAALALRDGRDTRVVRFPGQDELPAELSGSDLFARTPIRELVGAGIELDRPGELVVRTYAHVRPVFDGGDLVLVVVADGVGAVRPFELPVPRQCCETPDQFEARWVSYRRTQELAAAVPVGGRLRS